MTSGGPTWWAPLPSSHVDSSHAGPGLLLTVVSGAPAPATQTRPAWPFASSEPARESVCPSGMAIIVLITEVTSGPCVPLVRRVSRVLPNVSSNTFDQHLALGGGYDSGSPGSPYCQFPVDCGIYCAQHNWRQPLSLCHIEGD